MQRFISLLLSSLLLINTCLAGVACAQDEVVFYHTDNFGTPVAMTDMSGKVVWRADELPFGEQYKTEEISTKNNHRYLGRELDRETGLIYMGARYLDPATGRFNRPDPVGLVDPATGKINQEILLNPQRQNRYAYALNNPYRYADLDGNFAFIIAAAVGLWALDAIMPQSTDVPDSMGALDYIDNASIVAPAGAIKNVTKLPKVVNALKKMPFSEAKHLMSKWGKGSFDTVADSIRHHAGKHGGDDITKYLRKAASFNKRGAKKKVLDNGVTRWNRKSGEFLIERKGKIVTYGKNN